MTNGDTTASAPWSDLGNEVVASVVSTDGRPHAGTPVDATPVPSAQPATARSSPGRPSAGRRHVAAPVQTGLEG